MVDEKIPNTEQLENTLCIFMEQENELCRKFALTEVGQVTRRFLSVKGLTLLNISTIQLNRLVHMANEMYEKNRQIIYINKIIRNNVVSPDIISELSEDILKALEDLKEFSQNMIDLKNQKNVLEDMISSTYQNKDQNNLNNLNTIYDMLTEFWDETE